MSRPASFSSLLLNGKTLSVSGGNLVFNGSNVYVGTFAGNISDITGLQASLDSKLTSTSNLDATKLVGTIALERLPVIPGTSQVTSSGAILDLTSDQQAAIVTGTIVTTTDGRRWSYKGTGTKTLEASYILISDLAPSWSVISNKPDNLVLIAGNTTGTLNNSNISYTVSTLTATTATVNTVTIGTAHQGKISVDGSSLTSSNSPFNLTLSNGNFVISRLGVISWPDLASRNSTIQNLGLTIGTNVQAYSDVLQGIADSNNSVSISVDSINANSFNGAPLGSAAFFEDGQFDSYGSAATVQDASLQKTQNLSDLASVSQSRTNLGLGDSATKNIGTTAGSVAAGNDTRFSTGGLTSISFSAPSALFNTPVNFTFSSSTATAGLSFANVAANSIFGNFTASTSAPVFSSISTFKTTYSIASSASNSDITSLTASALSISPVSLGTLNNITIGGVTPAGAIFTTLTATNSVSLSPVNQNVVLSPTGTGTVTINPATLGTINNVSIGTTTSSTGKFTSLTATGIIQFSTTNQQIYINPAGSSTVVIYPAGGGSINNMSVGAGFPSSGAFTSTSLRSLLFLAAGGKTGTFTLTTGTITVTNSHITNNSVVVVTLKTASGTRAGVPDIVINNGVGFTATSSSGLDNSTYNYCIIDVNG